MKPQALVWLFAIACQVRPLGHRLAAPLAERAPLAPCSATSDTYCGEESGALLDNPHQGITSFYRYASALPFAEHPRARVAYMRYWWSEIEPAPGALQFSILDQALADAAAEGQTFAFRIMPEESADGAMRVPKWLAETAGGTWGRHGSSGRFFSPNYNAPEFIAASVRTIAALGARYDGDPRLEHVDVGLVGDGGEWAYAVDGAPMPNAKTTLAILDAFAAAFRKTPVLMLIGAVDDGAAPLSAAIARGFGWRADCWGDIRAGWNHHDDFYEQQLTLAGAVDTWKQHPVAVETCGEMRQHQVAPRANEVAQPRRRVPCLGRASLLHRERVARCQATVDLCA